MQSSSQRIVAINEKPTRFDGEYVLYWMIAHRRAHWNFALQRAVELAQVLGKPIVILEALRVDYPWASDRIHRFVMEGMRENARAFAQYPVTYVPYLEPAADQGKGLLSRLAQDAAVVVTDDFPCFFLPRMVLAAADRIQVRFEKVDSNGIMPPAFPQRAFSVAYHFRNFIMKHGYIAAHPFPEPDPLESVQLPPLKEHVRVKLAPLVAQGLEALTHEPSVFPIDHSVAPVSYKGGSEYGRSLLEDFIETKLNRYGEQRDHPDANATSLLSPYLHFGHLSAHEVVAAVLEHENLSPAQCGPTPDGVPPVGESAAEFLDQIITWRELGYNMCRFNVDYDKYDSLPEWSRATLESHVADPRPTIYSPEELEEARTADPVWNAAQRQLAQEGRIHNYLRMLWGKRVLEWTSHPAEALQTLIHLNNKYALDGRDPNSYSGIFWIFGRYDRAFGPERRVFGKVRYMSSTQAVRKLKMKRYLAKFGGNGSP